MSSSPERPSAALPSETLYHMCHRQLWEAALASQSAYYPPTFEFDGYFTHATADPKLLLTTANHFYTRATGDWICIEINQEALRKVGIWTRFELAAPVGDTSAQESNTLFPHIYGGIPGFVPGVVTNIYPMLRDDRGSFLGIVGLVEPKGPAVVDNAEP